MEGYNFWSCHQCGSAYTDVAIKCLECGSQRPGLISRVSAELPDISSPISTAISSSPSGTDSPGAMTDSREFALVWERQIVPFLVTSLPVWLKSPLGRNHDHSYAVDVFGEPKTGGRTVHITVPQQKRLAWRIMVAGRILERLPTPIREATRFLFFRGHVERVSACYAHGVDANRPDPACAPVNNHFEASPSMGASIGVEGNTVTSATLGGRILLQDSDGKYAEHFLTCFHPFEGEKAGAKILQPSPHEAVLLRERISRIDEMINRDPQLDHHFLSLQEERMDCEDILKAYPKEDGMRLGSLLASSGERSVDCPNDLPMVDNDQGVLLDGKIARAERDWAIGPICPSRSGRNLLPSGAFSTSEVRRAGRFQPGAEALAIGRTSGVQRGRISDRPSVIKFKNRPDNQYNREWVVLGHEMDSEVHWVSHGIGMPGDSGSWLVGQDGVLYGMIWGRNINYGSVPRKAFFTPILDVFEDIGTLLAQEPPILPQPIGEDGTIDPALVYSDLVAGMGDSLTTTPYIQHPIGLVANPESTEPETEGTADPVLYDPLVDIRGSPPLAPCLHYPAEMDPDFVTPNPEIDELPGSLTSHFDDAYYWPIRSLTKQRGKIQRLSGAISRHGRGRGGHNMLAMRSRLF